MSDTTAMAREFTRAAFHNFGLSDARLDEYATIFAELMDHTTEAANARIAELEAERDRLKAALKPLASLIKFEQFETNIVAENDLITCVVRVGDIEAARATLSGEGVT